MLDGVVMAMILVITVITQDWHKLDEDKFDADGPPIIRNWRQHKIRYHTLNALFESVSGGVTWRVSPRVSSEIN